nr:hypothetical protein [Tanacetum cinerariifolium]
MVMRPIVGYWNSHKYELERQSWRERDGREKHMKNTLFCVCKMIQPTPSLYVERTFIQKINQAFHGLSMLWPGEYSRPLGEVLLEITIGEGPLTVTKTLNFAIVRSDSPHNLLLRRTAMQQMGIVVSTIHGAIKFHTHRGIGTVLSQYNPHRSEEKQIITNEEHQEDAKDIHSCVVAQEMIVVSAQYPEQTIVKRRQLLTKTKIELQDLLRVYADVFAWTTTHMTGVNPLKVKAISDLQPPKTVSELQNLRRKLVALNRFLSKEADKTLPFMRTLKSCTSRKMVQWKSKADEAFQRIKELLEALSTVAVPTKGETLIMYLMVSEKSIRVALMAKRGKRQSSVSASEERKPFEEGETAATPPPFGYRVTARISVQPHILMPFRSESEVERLLAIPTPPLSVVSPTSYPLPPFLMPLPIFTLLPTSSFPLPSSLSSTSGSESIPEADIPLRNRARFTTPTGGYEVGESSIDAAAR